MIVLSDWSRSLNVAFLLVNWKILETVPRGRKVRLYLVDKYLERGQIRMDLSFPNKSRIWGSGSCGNNRRPSNIPPLHIIWTSQQINNAYNCSDLTFVNHYDYGQVVLSTSSSGFNWNGPQARKGASCKSQRQKLRVLKIRPVSDSV